MVTLFQHRRNAAVGRDARRARHRITEDNAITPDREELRALIAAASHNGEEELQMTTMITVTPSTRPLSLLTPPQRQRRQRYRSRNCANFQRYGDFFQFTTIQSSDATDDSDSLLRTQGRRSLRGYNRLQADELRDLQARVAELERQRDLMHSAMVNSYLTGISHAVEMVQQFYELFANGYDPIRFPEQSHTTEAFMRAVMKHDVLCTEFKGVDLFLNQYQVSSQAHTSFRLALLDIQVITDEHDDAIRIRASATCTLRIKRATLEQLFSAIIVDEALTQQLIGKAYVLQYDKVFHFQRGLVFQHESRVDLGKGILAMVGDPFAATKLLEASVMTKHGHLKLDSRIEEDAHTLENTIL